MKMQITRQLNYSFMYFMLEELSKKVKKVTLTSEDGYIFRIPHQNIVITKDIKIYTDDGLVDNSEYAIFPKKNIVEFVNKIDKDVTATYNYSIVNVIGQTDEELIRPPLIAFENSGDSDYNFELGSSLSNTEASYYIHLYGVNESQRDDLCDVIKGSLKKTLCIYDYNKGFPLASDGSIQDIEIPIVNYADFVRVNVKKNPLKSTDEIESGRALISVVCRYIN